MLRRLLNIASIVCLVACVALMGMWVRSYHWNDSLTAQAAHSKLYQVATCSGQMEVSLGCRLVGPITADLHSWSVGSYESQPNPFLPTSGMPNTLQRIGFNSSGPIFVMPFWFLVLTSGSLAMLFQLRWPLRFNLRSLFIATTFLAVVLGMIAWLDRAWIGK
jgi:hypothetical protein